MKKFDFKYARTALMDALRGRSPLVQERTAGLTRQAKGIGRTRPGGSGNRVSKRVASRFFAGALAACTLAAAQSLAAETRAGVFVGANAGEQIFETGSRQPDLRGFAGGSRLTYPRNFNFFGAYLLFLQGPLEFRAALGGTGWYVESGEARNEDFTLNERSTVRRNGFDESNWSFRDSAYVITGSRNFADAKGRSSLIDWRTDLLARFFPFAPRATARAEGLFLELGLSYWYNKQYVYDATQYIGSGSTILIAPIGQGNSLSNVIWEVPIGAGYRMGAGDWAFDVVFAVISGYNYGRDFHFQRNITFEIKHGYGTGFYLRSGAEYRLSEATSLRLNLWTRRYYSEGLLHSRGGLGEEALLVAFSGSQRMWLSSKESSFDVSIERRLSWGAGAASEPAPHAPQPAAPDAVQEPAPDARSPAVTDAPPASGID